MKKHLSISTNMLTSLMIIALLLTMIDLAGVQAQSAPAWQPNTYYSTGDYATYGDSTYYCLQSHTSLTGWEPPNTPALWQYTGGGSQPPGPNVCLPGVTLIEGQVVDSSSDPIADATVTVSSWWDTGANDVIFSHTGSDQTDSNGNYSLYVPNCGTEAGFIKVYADGYEPEITNRSFAINDEALILNFELDDAGSSEIVYAGLRQSYYGATEPVEDGPEYDFPAAAKWESGMKAMSGYFSGSTPLAVWIISEVNTDSSHGGTILFFDGEDETLIEFDPDTVNHETYLNHFDGNGIKVFLQVEPGFADVERLIDLVLDEYKTHSCVVGFGVDVEWYQNSTDGNDGVPVTNDTALKWEMRVKKHNPNYQLFLKHFSEDWMPSHYRGDIVFVDDSQLVSEPPEDQNGQELYDMMEEFAEAVYPNDVLYQIGYPYEGEEATTDLKENCDVKWWSDLTTPYPKTFGNNLLAVTSDGQKAGIVWVDFSMRYVWPTIFPIESTQPPQPRAWQPGVQYEYGNLVSYNGSVWECVYAHTSYLHWYPGAPGLWFWQEQ